MLSNQESSFTYINYVASNETEVDTFSQNLYKSMSHAPSGSIYTAVNDREHISFGGLKKPHSIGLKLTTINQINPYIIGDKNLMRYEPILINSSGTYTINGGYTTLTITERVFNTTYTRLVIRCDNHKLRWYEIWESYHNADVVKVTYNITTTDTQNITDIYLRIRELYPYANSDQIALDSNTIKVNASSAFSDWITDNGIAIKQVSGNGTEISGVYNNFYVENGTSERIY